MKSFSFTNAWRYLAILLLAQLATAPLVLADEQAGNGGVMSLRGSNPIEAQSAIPAKKRWAKDGEPIPRSFAVQPPLIPHSIKGYRINLKFNKCLTCHSRSNFEGSGAPRISLTHFSGRDGRVFKEVAPRRYFCTQCHVAQVHAAPLVDNTYQPVKPIKRLH